MNIEVIALTYLQWLVQKISLSACVHKLFEYGRVGPNISLLLVVASSATVAPECHVFYKALYIYSDHMICLLLTLVNVYPLMKLDQRLFISQ